MIKTLKSLSSSDNYSQTSLNSFHIKILGNLLPLRNKLHTYYPLLYPSDLCPRCSNSTENLDYLFNCTQNTPLLPEIQKIFSKFSNSHNISKMTNWKDIKLLTINLLSYNPSITN